MISVVHRVVGLRAHLVKRAVLIYCTHCRRAAREHGTLSIPHPIALDAMLSGDEIRLTTPSRCSVLWLPVW